MTRGHSRWQPVLREDVLCAGEKKSFYLLSNSHELNEAASDVLRAAIMREFPRGSRGRAKSSSQGLCGVVTVTVDPVSITARCLLLLAVAGCCSWLRSDTRIGRVLTIHILCVD